MSMSNIPPKKGPEDLMKQWKIDHAGRIDQLSFKYLPWIVTILATVPCLARLISHLKKQHRLFLDDLVILFANMCLIAASCIQRDMSDKIFILEAVNSDPTIILSLEERLPLVGINTRTFATNLLLWTTICAVKFYFLIFFWPMVRNTSVVLNRFYWTTVSMATICWIFTICQHFIVCPYFGRASIKCYEKTNLALGSGVGNTTITLDISTDVMIVTIPLLLLRQSLMKTTQRVRIAMLLCLSSAMIVISIVRLAVGLHVSNRGIHEFSVDYAHIILHIEAAVAIMMACIIAFRTIFAGQLVQISREPCSSVFRDMLSCVRIIPLNGERDSRKRRTGECPQESIGLNAHVSMKGFQTSINGERKKEAQLATHRSLTDSVDDYHNYMREITAACATKQSISTPAHPETAHQLSSGHSTTIGTLGSSSPSSETC